jgi:hypothetical protein
LQEVLVLKTLLALVLAYHHQLAFAPGSQAAQQAQRAWHLALALTAAEAGCLPQSGRQRS